jgi:hypothetical protein
MSIRNKIDRLQDKLRKTKQDIKDLQSKCEHSETKVGFEQTSESSVSIRIICTECNKLVGWPTEQQKKDFLK